MLPDGDVVVIGAGAAGLAAAAFLRRLDPSRRVTLLDGAARPGAKILISGGSRCNVTNVSVSEREFCGGKPTVIRQVLRGFTVAETIDWFASLGVSLHEEAHGKLFPDTNRSRDVLDALLREADASGAVLKAGTRVTGLTRTDDGFQIETAAGSLAAAAVILATGGQSIPKSGSDGAGLELARRLGHTIVPTTPALVPLLVDHGSALQGVAQDVELSIWTEGARTARLSGALLWTHFGVSGPVVLDASRHWLRARLEQRAVRMTVSLCPGDDFETLERFWTSAAAERPRASLASAAARLLPASIGAAILAGNQLDPQMPLAHFTRGDRRRLVQALLEWPLAVTASRGYDHAEATAGGVALEEIDPGSMASRRCDGLYLIGEMLDADGRIGGFNFQWAWASARVAARALASRRDRTG